LHEACDYNMRTRFPERKAKPFIYNERDTSGLSINKKMSLNTTPIKATSFMITDSALIG